MFNWTEICTKYRSYQLANDYGGMVATLNQIKSFYGLATNAQALQLIIERCDQYYPGFQWELPTNPEAEIDCYDCRAEIMQRYMAVEGCPSGWISSPVSASTKLSNNPCKQRNTTSSRNYGTSNFSSIEFYKTNGRAIGDPVLQRGGSLSGAVNTKIGNTLTTPKARKYERTRGVNRNVIGGVPTARNPYGNPVINPSVRTRRKRLNNTRPKNWLQRIFG
tara:strand:+ start:3506 stop:4165 length:660 start_codon:yes stop_codon:yes gene_type:complete